MKAIADFTGLGLRWSQPAGLERAYELRAGEELLATLRFRGGSLAEAETVDGVWTLNRQGFLRPQVTVRRPGSESDVAVFRPYWTGGGELVAGVGAGLEFVSANFWNSEWVWRDANQLLVTYREPHGLLKANAAVEIAAEARQLTTIGLLTVLGWYLILLFGRDMAIATATRASSVVTVNR